MRVQTPEKGRGCVVTSICIKWRKEFEVSVVAKQTRLPWLNGMTLGFGPQLIYELTEIFIEKHLRSRIIHLIEHVQSIIIATWYLDRRNNAEIIKHDGVGPIKCLLWMTWLGLQVKLFHPATTLFTITSWYIPLWLPKTLSTSLKDITAPLLVQLKRIPFRKTPLRDDDENVNGRIRARESDEADKLERSIAKRRWIYRRSLFHWSILEFSLFSLLALIIL